MNYFQIPEDKFPILKQEFNIDFSNTRKFLEDIFKANFHKKLFFDLFFVDNREIINQANSLLKKLLDNNYMFHVLHGYSKNGKSTFINWIIHEYNKGEESVLDIHANTQDIHLKLFSLKDFEDGDMGSIKKKMEHLFNNNFVLGEDIEQIKYNIKRLKKFNEFIQEFISSLYENKDSFNESLIIEFESYFNETRLIVDNYFKNIERIDTMSLNEIKVDFSKKISEEIQKASSGKFFIYHIFYELFSKGNVFLKKEKTKLIFVLDNIDDYLINDDIDFLNQPQFELVKFISLLTHDDNTFSRTFIKTLVKYNSINNSVEPEFSFRNQISFLYIFRTANFLIFSKLLHSVVGNEVPSSAIDRNIPEYFDDNYSRYRTLDLTSEIIRRRIDIFEQTLNYYKKLYQVEELTGKDFFKNLSNNYFSFHENYIRNKIHNIFYLWNGDKIAMWKKVFDNYGELSPKFYKYEGYIEKIMRSSLKPKYNELIEGAYLYYFLFLYKKNDKLESIMNQLIYSFKSYRDSDKKNFKRFILNYIINNSEKLRMDFKKISYISKEGISLYKLLEDFQNFIDKVNIVTPNTYSFEEVEHFFRDLCNDRIDSFAQYVNIYKNQINTNRTYINQYDLNYEINLYKTTKKYEKERESLYEDREECILRKSEIEKAYTQYKKDSDSFNRSNQEIIVEYEKLYNKFAEIDTLINEAEKEKLKKELNEKKIALQERKSFLKERFEALELSRKGIQNRKGTETNSINVIANRIEELTKLIEENIKTLDNVRIYNTNNAAFLSYSLIYHFEFTSFVNSFPLEKEPSDMPAKPLIFAIDKTVQGEAKTIEDFEFHEIINNVYNETKSQMTSIVDFYVKTLLKADEKSTPEEFLLNPMFSIFGRNREGQKQGVFQFRLLISRHIRYLDFFRVVLLNDVIKTHSEEEKRMIDKFLLGIFEKYCKLYIDSYRTIDNEIRIRRTDRAIQHPLYESCQSFCLMQHVLKKLLKKDSIDKRELNEIVKDYKSGIDWKECPVGNIRYNSKK